MKWPLLSLGDVALGYGRDLVPWLADLCRYQTARFVGYTNGRLFIGVLWGSKDGSGKWELRRREETS